MNQPIIVQKYGGSSMATASKIKAVAEQVRRRRDDGKRLCVVVSAMGKTTDELVALAKDISDAPPRRELDMLLSCGERVSMALLAMALSERGVSSISFTGSQSGIITNDNHTDARILEVRPYRVQDELDRDRVVIVAGFQGVSYRKEITTLGRGGSDTTAVALAAALGAEACEIFSDVDGVYTADPRVVPNAQPLPALSYEEMQELSAAGAKVLNAQAVQFAKNKGIALYAKKTGGGDGGTVIRKDAPKTPGTVRGIAHKARLFVLQGELNTLLPYLDARDVTPVSVQNDRVLLAPENIHSFEFIKSSLPAGVVCLDEVGAVSLIGEGVLSARGVVAKALANVDSLRGFSTSRFRVTALVPPKEVHALANRWHSIFVDV